MIEFPFFDELLIFITWTHINTECIRTVYKNLVILLNPQKWIPHQALFCGISSWNAPTVTISICYMALLIAHNLYKAMVVA